MAEALHEWEIVTVRSKFSERLRETGKITILIGVFEVALQESLSCLKNKCSTINVNEHGLFLLFLFYILSILLL